MPKKQNFDLSRELLANELRTVAQSLLNVGVCGDVSPLERAASICQSHQNDEWGYDLSGLIIRLGKLDKAFPTKQSEVSCSINCTLKGKLIHNMEYCDPYEELQLHLLFEAEPKKGGEKFFQTWHLDRDSRNATASESHPRYHFHFGGKAMTRYANVHKCKQECHSFGKLLLLPSPRLLHFPLDAILAIDFILANNIGAIWRTLRNNPQYLQAIRSSQKRNWFPFAAALNGHWEKQKTHSNQLLALDLYPDIC